MLSLGANNSSTLTGDTYIEQGYIRITADNQLGPTSSTIHLNGGGLYTSGAGNITLSALRQILVGTNGGAFSNDNGGDYLTIPGVIADDSPGGGLVYAMSGYTIFQGATRTAAARWCTAPWSWSTAPRPEQARSTSCRAANSWARSGTINQSTSMVFLNGGERRRQVRSDRELRIHRRLSGDGDYQFGVNGDWPDLQTNPTLTVGALQSSDFYGRILQVEGNRDDTLTYAGGQGNVIKVGNTTLTLWGECSWMGTTTINQGTLQINGGLCNGTGFAGGAVTVNAAGTLGGSGTVQRNVVLSGGTLTGTLAITGTVTSSGLIVPGTSGTPGTISITGNLTLNASSQLYYDLGATSDLISMGAGSSAPTLAGKVFVNPLSGFGLGGYALITYPVATSAPSVASMSAASSSPLSSLLNYTFNSSTTQVSLNIARNTTAGAFTWVGGTSGAWDGATNGNWTATDSTGTYTVVGLYPGLVTTDTANVGLTSTPTTITLGSAQTIGTLNLMGTGAFSLSGSA